MNIQVLVCEVHPQSQVPYRNSQQETVHQYLSIRRIDLKDSSAISWSTHTLAIEEGRKQIKPACCLERPIKASDTFQLERSTFHSTVIQKNRDNGRRDTS